MKTILIVAIILSGCAQRPVYAQQSNKVWAWSVVAMSAGSGLDAWSSWHQQESNPILRGHNGQFGTKGVSIKAGVIAGVVIMEWRMRRHYPSRVYGWSNYAGAGIFSGEAIRNWRTK